MDCYRSLVIPSFVVVLVAATLAQDAAPPEPAPPATQPAPRAFHLSALIVKDIAPIPAFLQATTTATIATINQAVNLTFYPLMDQAKAAGVPLEGPPVFVYHSMTADPNEPFQMDVGFAVAAGTQPFGEFSIASLAPFHCASFYYTGPAAGMPTAYPQAFAQLAAAGLLPSGVIREVAMYWEGEASPNNVVDIQIGLAHTPVLGRQRDENVPAPPAPDTEFEK